MCDYLIGLLRVYRPPSTPSAMHACTHIIIVSEEEGEGTKTDIGSTSILQSSLRQTAGKDPLHNKHQLRQRIIALIKGHTIYNHYN